MLCFVIALLFSVAPAHADPPAAMMHRLLLYGGYQAIGSAPTSIGGVSHIYVSRGSVAGIDLDRHNRLTSATLVIYDAKDASTYYGLGAGYLAVQAALGKLQNYTEDPQTLVRKGTYLLDAIGHNLRHLDKTTFTFDDMAVVAGKNEADRVIIIVLAPRWRR